MARFDWDRETREARKRAHGSIPSWADPVYLSHDDEREVRRLLEPMVTLIEEYEALSNTQRRQNGSDFAFKIQRLMREAVSEAGGFADTATRASLSLRAEMLVERIRELAQQASR